LERAQALVRIIGFDHRKDYFDSAQGREVFDRLESRGCVVGTMRQFQKLRPFYRLLTTVDIQLGVNLPDIPFDRGGGQHQSVRDFDVGQPFNHHPQNVDFSFSEGVCQWL